MVKREHIEVTSGLDDMGEFVKLLVKQGYAVMVKTVTIQKIKGLEPEFLHHEVSYAKDLDFEQES